jgi:hypothetical protein
MPKHWLLGSWYPRGLIVHHQRYLDSTLHLSELFIAKKGINASTKWIRSHIHVLQNIFVQKIPRYRNSSKFLLNNQRNKGKIDTPCSIFCIYVVYKLWFCASYNLYDTKIQVITCTLLPCTSYILCKIKPKTCFQLVQLLRSEIGNTVTETDCEHTERVRKRALFRIYYRKLRMLISSQKWPIQI